MLQELICPWCGGKRCFQTFDSSRYKCLACGGGVVSHDAQDVDTGEIVQRGEKVETMPPYNEKARKRETQHPPQVRVGVACFVFNEAGDFLVMKRKGSHGAGTWGLPGGHIEFGEKVTECASREVREETGIYLPASYYSYTSISEAVFADEQKHYITVICFCDCLVDAADVRIVEPEKCSEIRWVKRSTLPSPLFPPLAEYLRSNPKALSK